MVSVKGLFVAGAVVGGTIVASAYQMYAFRPLFSKRSWSDYLEATMENAGHLAVLEAFAVLPPAYAVLYFCGAPRARI